MSKYEESGVSLILEIEDYRRNVQEAISLATELESTLGGLSDFTVDVTVEADLGSVEDDISSISEEAPIVTVEADLEESSDLLALEELDNETLNTTVDTTVEDPTGDLEVLETIDEKPKNVEIDTKEGGEKVGGKSLLTTIHELGINPVQIVMNVAGKILDVLNAINTFSVQPMLDLDDAVAKVNAQTASAIPNARELVSGIFYDDLGESVGQVADLVIQAQQLQAPVDEATRAALTFTHTFQDQNPETVLRSLNTLVSTGLAPSFTDAGNLLVAAFQNGGDKAGDLLNVIDANSQSWADMGLNGSQALSVITSLLQGGVDTATDAAKGIQTIDDSLTTAAENAQSPQADALKTLGMDNPKEQGETAGADFWDAFSTKLGSLSSTEQDQVLGDLAGKAGKKFTGAFENLSTGQYGAYTDLVNKAADAATAIDDSLRGAIDDFMLSAQKAAEDFLSSDAIDLPGKIELIKTGIQDALNTLSEGGTLGEALTVALKPIGFDDEFKSLESALGNFVIGILQAVATLQEITGHGTEAAATRKTVGGMAQTQLAFDLQNISPEDAQGVADAVSTAFSRGLDPTTLGDALKTAVDEMVNSGNFKEAQALLDNFKRVQITLNPGQDVAGTNANISAGELAAQLAITRGGEQTGGMTQQGQTNAMLAVQAQTESTTALNDMANAATDLTATSRDTEQADIDRKGALDELKTTTEDATIDVDTLNVTTGELADAAFQANVASTLLGDSWADVSAQVADLQQKLADGKITVEQFDAAIVALTNSLASTPSAGGGSAVPATGKPVEANAAGGTFTGVSVVGEQGPELISSNRGLAVLNNRTTQAIMSALSPAGMSMSTDYSGGNTYVVNNNNYVQSQASADALGYSTAKQLRGI